MESNRISEEVTKCAHLLDRALETYFLPALSKEMLLDLCVYYCKSRLSHSF